MQVIAFDAERQNLNDFTATNQYRVQGVKQCRDDTVLLVNGIPLVVAEYKSFVTSGDDWARGSAPASPLPAAGAADARPHVFCVAADEDEFRYGTVLFHDASKEDVDRHLDQVGAAGSASTRTITAGGTRLRPRTPLTRWRRLSRVCCG